MTRDCLRALIRRHAGPEAVDEILRAAESYARWKAGVILAVQAARRVAGLYPPDDAETTARRREELERATWGRPDDEEAA
jgi:hypothetical protein